ncbi:MAG: DNRLRE domain-containing protein [Methylococcales bacterium]
MKKLTFVVPLLFAVVFLALFFNQNARALTTNPVSAGQVRFFNNANWEFDPHIDGAGVAQQDWMKSHYYRMLVHAPYFDQHNAWYPGGLAYLDSYGIYVDDPLVQSHPEWIMRDAQGNKLYIPWACQNGACSQFAGDFSHPGFRQYMIQKMTAIMSKGYRGLWLDDVNFTWRVSDGYENFVTPVDRITGKPMLLDNWRLYFVQYLEQVRAALPNAEITHNTIWFADAVDAQNPYINREIDAADYINLERGGNDAGLVGGGDTWGYETFLKFVDYVHGRGADVIIMDIGTNKAELEYGLATWLLISQGNDLLSNNAYNKLANSAPNTWWTGYDLKLGNAVNTRYAWNNLLRRDFACGMVLLNQPDMPTRTVSVGNGYKNLSGQVVTSVTLVAKQAVVLTSTCQTSNPVTPPPVVIKPSIIKTFQQGVNGYNGARDTSINSASPTSNSGTTTTLMMQGNIKRAALLAWDVSQIPVGSKIEKVELSFNNVNTSVNSYEIYEMKQPWQERQATWRSYATGKVWNVAGAIGALDKGTTILGALNGITSGQLSVSLNSSGIALVQSWVNNAGLNRGFVIMDYLAADNLVVNAKEISSAAQRPKLTVTYKLP